MSTQFVSGDIFSLHRFIAIVQKEFIQMRRDRLTFGIMIGVPLMQIIIFGFAINNDPKHLPTVVISADQSIFSRSLLSALRNSDYFSIVGTASSEEEGQRLLEEGRVQFVVNIPQNFSHDLIRGKNPAILIEVDATDPAASSNAIFALNALMTSVFGRDLRGPLASFHQHSPGAELRVHRLYNPEGITQYNVVPGLMGVVLTMTMVMITSLAITRERERGTMENLLATPATPFEVMIGKIVPYILVGYIQVTLILLAARLIFGVPIVGSLLLLYIVTLAFILANLSVGITFSTVARNQLQAVQMSFFFFLPSILLSGFMFPFRGMPAWAQAVGSIIPNTHFLRLVRGILLKGNGIDQALHHVWPIVIFLIAALSIATFRYRRTLD